MSAKRPNTDHPTFQRAVAEHQAGRLAEAADLYRQVLAETPNHIPALRLLAALEAAQGRNDLAVELLTQAVGQAPKDAALRAELGEYCRRAGQLEAAVGHCRQAMALQPYLASGYYNLGVVLQQLRQLEEAAGEYEQALHLDAGNANAEHNLGVIRRDQGRGDEAIAAYQRALAINPDHIEARGNLGVALHQQGRFEEAIACFQRVLALRPGDGAAQHNLAQALQAAGRMEEAEAAYRAAIALGPASGRVHQDLGALLEKLGRPSEAIPLLKEALRRGVDAPDVRYYMAAATGQDAPTAAPPEHIKALFDPAADRFDDHLVGGLHYRAPQDLYAAVCAAYGLPSVPESGAPDATARRPEPTAGHSPASFGDVLDLGCGTGLCAVLFQPHARSLVGVDLSAGMLEKARQRGLYDGLVCADLLTVLQEHPRSFDLILAADVFVYIGDLAAIFAGAAAALRPGGLFAFSVEAHEPASRDSAGYLLHAKRRYAHSAAYLRQLASAQALAEMALTPATIRLEAGQPVAGYIVVLRLPTRSDQAGGNGPASKAY